MGETELYGDLPALVTGDGSPLLVLSGLSSEHTNPTGMERWMLQRMVRPWASRFTVHLVNRRPGLPPGTTMHDLAADVAGAIRRDFEPPIPVVGVSTGGSIALQLAIDHPDLVQRVALISAACRLSPHGRDVQRQLAELTEAGRPRAAWAPVGSAMAAGPISGWLMAALLWLAGRSSDPDDPSDMLATIRAEDEFDVSPELHRITAPALIVAGGRDRLYSPELFRVTAEGIPDARLVLYPRKGHGAVVGYRPALDEVTRFLTTA